MAYPGKTTAGYRFFSLALGPVSGITKATQVQTTATPTSIRIAKLRLWVASKMRPATQGPTSDPIYPMESIIPLAAPTDSFGTISTGRASTIEKITLPAIPRTTIRGQNNETGI